MANFNLNKVIIGGRLTADPELKTTPSGVSVCSFSVAVNRRFSNKESNENQVDFLNVVSWRQTAEFVSRFFHKGSSICITGSIQNRSWTDNQGNKRYATDIVADEVFFVDSKGETSSAQSYVPDNYGNPSFSNADETPKFEEIADDEEIPF